MAHVDSNDRNSTHSRSDELPPSCDPRGAFAWTLRSAEIARRERDDVRGRRNGSRRRITLGPRNLRYLAPTRRAATVVRDAGPKARWSETMLVSSS